jgi:hypothetical protein
MQTICINSAAPENGLIRSSSSDFKEIMFSRSRKAAEVSKGAPRAAAMATFDHRRRGCIFRAFKHYGKAITNPADDFKPAL